MSGGTSINSLRQNGRGGNLQLPQQQGGVPVGSVPEGVTLGSDDGLHSPASFEMTAPLSAESQHSQVKSSMPYGVGVMGSGLSKKKPKGFLNDFKGDIQLDDMYLPLFAVIVYIIGHKRFISKIVDDKLNTTMGMYITLIIVGLSAYFFQKTFFV